MFKVGMRVRLKSGGALMTITSVKELANSPPAVMCEWFLKDGTTHTGLFLTAVLMSQDGLT